MLRTIVILGLTTLGHANVAFVNAASAAGEPAQPAVSAILDAQSATPITAVAARVDRRQDFEFLSTLVRDYRFAGRFGDIVVEFGSTKYQHRVDQFVRGEIEDVNELRPALLDTSEVCVWDSPAYLDFFEVVREANRSLDPDQRIRIVLGEPEVDWNSPRDVERAATGAYRDEFLLALVRRIAIEEDRRILLIGGRERLLYLDLLGKDVQLPSLGARLKASDPEDVRVYWVIPASGIAARNIEVEDGLPAFVSTRATEFGQRPTTDVLEVWDTVQNGRLPQLCHVGDGVVYLGHNERVFATDLGNYLNPDLVLEWRRRAELLDEAGPGTRIGMIDRKVRRASSARLVHDSGYAVARDRGFAYSVELEENVVLQGDPVLVEFTWTNETSALLVIDSPRSSVRTRRSWADGMRSFEVTRDGQDVPYRGGVGSLATQRVRRLAAGESVRLADEISRFYDLSAPGSYKITTAFESDPKTTPSEQAWRGRLVTRRIELIVLPK